MLDKFVNNGFKYAATFTKVEPYKKNKYGMILHTEDDISEWPGVYLLVKGKTILKIGECVNLVNRMRNYCNHAGPTNTFVREGFELGETYDVFYLDCPQIMVTYGGVETSVGVNYKDLEKKILDFYSDNNKSLPKLNKGRS